LISDRSKYLFGVGRRRDLISTSCFDLLPPIYPTIIPDDGTISILRGMGPVLPDRDQDFRRKADEEI